MGEKFENLATQMQGGLSRSELVDQIDLGGPLSAVDQDRNSFIHEKADETVDATLEAAKLAAESYGGGKAAELVVIGGVRLATKGHIHHTATNIAIKSGFTDWFRRIFGRAGKSLEDSANKVFLEGHAGRHSPAYHQHVLDRLQNATRGLSGDAYGRALDAELGALRGELLKNPDLVRGSGL